MISQDNWHHKNRSWRRFQRERCIMNRVREVLHNGLFKDFDPALNELLDWSQWTQPRWRIRRFPIGYYAKKKPYDCGTHHSTNNGHHCSICHCGDKYKHRNVKLHTAADSDLEDWLNEG